jgi:hypothetical protein
MAPKAAPEEPAVERRNSQAATPPPAITPIPIDPVQGFQQALELERQIDSRVRKLSFVIAHGQSSLQQLQKEQQCLRNPTKACVKRLDAGPAVRAGRAKLDNQLSYILSPRRGSPHAIPETWPAKGARFHLTSQLKRELEAHQKEGPTQDAFCATMDPETTLSNFTSLRSTHEDLERYHFDHRVDVKEDLEALQKLPLQAALEATSYLIKELTMVRAQLQELLGDKCTLGFPCFPGPRQRPPPMMTNAGVSAGPDDALQHAMQLESKAGEQWIENWNMVKTAQKEGARAFHGSLMPLDTWEEKATPRFLRHQF